jgi:hypothetical protein
MKRVVVVVFFLLATANDAAQSPAPTLVRFDAADPPGQYTDALLDRSPGCIFDRGFLNVTNAYSAPTSTAHPVTRGGGFRGPAIAVILRFDVRHINAGPWPIGQVRIRSDNAVLWR